MTCAMSVTRVSACIGPSLGSDKPTQPWDACAMGPTRQSLGTGHRRTLMRHSALATFAASLLVAGGTAATAPDAKSPIGVAEFTRSLNGRPGVFVLRSVEQQ